MFLQGAESRWKGNRKDKRTGGDKTGTVVAVKIFMHCWLHNTTVNGPPIYIIFCKSVTEILIYIYIYTYIYLDCLNNRVNRYRGLTKENSWGLLKIAIFERYVLHRPQNRHLTQSYKEKKYNHKSRKYYFIVWITLSKHFLLLDFLILYKNPSVHRICTQ